MRQSVYKHGRLFFLDGGNDKALVHLNLTYARNGLHYTHVDLY